MSSVLELSLTTASPTSDEVFIDELKANYRELSIKDTSGTPWAAGASVSLERYLSSAIGWEAVNVSMTASTKFSATYNIAGGNLLDLARIGKIRFVLTGGDGSTNVKITLA